MECGVRQSAETVETGGFAYNGTVYRDEGCDLHPSCLTCPLPSCRYEMRPKQAQAYIMALKLATLLPHGLTAGEMAEQIGRSRRQVFRLLPLARTLARRMQRVQQSS